MRAQIRASLSMGLLSLASLELIHCLECGQVSFKVSAEKAQVCLGRLQGSEVLSTAVLTMERTDLKECICLGKE